MDTSRSKSGSRTESLTTRAMWAVLAVVIIADVMDLLDATITNIAAPTIVRDLGGGQTLIKWLGSSYALALGVLLVMGGRLGDRYGQRRLFLTGIAGFTLASLACGLSVGPFMIIVARLFQGAFGALLIPQGIAIMTAHFSRDMKDKAFSLFGPALGLAMVGGPILAGFMIDANIAGTGWRAMFLINLVLGTVGFIVALRVLPRDTGDKSVDPRRSRRRPARGDDVRAAVRVDRRLESRLDGAPLRLDRHRPAGFRSLLLPAEDGGEPADQAVAAGQSRLHLRSHHGPGALHGHQRAVLRALALSATGPWSRSGARGVGPDARGGRHHRGFRSRHEVHRQARSPADLLRPTDLARRRSAGSLRSSSAGG